MSFFRAAVTVIVCLSAIPAAARAQAGGRSAPAADSAAVVQVVEQFHAALAAGDSAAVLRLLHDDAVVLETGDMETRHEYRGHHLPADIAFARAVPRQVGAVRVTVRDNVAWVMSTSTARGRYRERDVNSQTAELAVLERTAEGWRIAAIHWSSRTLR
jgi:ketosteroid isomerase-like protein